MTLARRLPGRARLKPGRPWRIEIELEAEWMGISVLREGEAWPREREGLPLPAPAWGDIDRHLADKGCARKGPLPAAAPEGGMEFDVLCFGHALGSWPGADGGRRPPDTIAVSLPPMEVGDMQRALGSLAAGLSSRRDAELVASLMARINEAGAVTVQFPVDRVWSLQRLLRSPAYRGDLSEDSARALDNLNRHFDTARPVTGPWPQVRDALQDALRDALSRPGAGGLAARDELLDIVRRFVDTHRTATAADDVEQRRLQAERQEPEG
ncbi:hypothetical protein GCM10010416_79070 [Streptomyces caniferus]